MISTETKEWLDQVKQRLHQDPEARGAFAVAFNVPIDGIARMLETELGALPKGLQGKELADLNRAMGVATTAQHALVDSRRLKLPTVTPTEMRSRLARRG